MLVYIEIVVAFAVLLLMRRVVTGVQQERAYRRATVFIGVLLVSAALTILTIGARSPYTHANLQPGRDPGYTRTEQIYVGPGEPYGGTGSATGRTEEGPVAEGARVFVTKGCAACHALEGRGGAVGPPIAGTDLETLRSKVRKGPSGMPHFSAETLTEEELAAIAAYLGSLAAPTPSPGN